MMQIRIDRLVRPFIPCGMCAVLLSFCVILCLPSCKKSTPVAPPPITPLQALVNSDTTLTLYHRLLLQANEAGLLADKPVTLLIPGNAALRAAGYTAAYIDSIPASQADNLLRYNYIPSRVVVPVGDSTGYAAYATLSGFPVYVMSDGRHIWFNGLQVAGDTLSIGQAIVYRLSAILPEAADSLDHFAGGDTSLSFFNEALLRTGLDTLVQTGSFTILAPVNSAFINAGYDSLGAIDSADRAALTSLIKYHFAEGVFFTNTLGSQGHLSTLQGGSITVAISGGLIQFTGTGNATPASLVSGNQVIGPLGVLHRIDRLLMP